MKIFSRNPVFARKGLFSGLAVFVFSLISILPVLSQAYAGVSSDVPEALGDTAGHDQAAVTERCRLQRDMALLESVMDSREKAIQTDVPCEQRDVLAAAVPTVPDHDAGLGIAIRELVAGYPIEVMIPAIAKYDREIAALIVGIAKKESNWGKRVPVDADGADCFNYWGYTGAGSRGVEMGHGCFGSPEEAVTAVGNRLKHLVGLRETSEPKNMIIWKCGLSCQGHSDESVRKWIADVDIYYRRIASK